MLHIAPHGPVPSELSPEFLGSEDKSKEAGPVSSYVEAARIQPAWLALVEILHRVVTGPYH